MIIKLCLKYILCSFSLFNPDYRHIRNLIISGNNLSHSIFILFNRINLGFIKCFLNKCFFVIQNNLGLKRIFKNLWGTKYFLRLFFRMIKFNCSIKCQWITVFIKINKLVIKVTLWFFSLIIWKLIWYFIERTFCYQRKAVTAL